MISFVVSYFKIAAAFAEIDPLKGPNLVGNLFHGHFFSCHTFTIQLEMQQPWRNWALIKDRHLSVIFDPQ